MAFQLAPPSVTPYAPQTPQSQMLAQVMQQMQTQPQTPIGGSANMMAAVLNRMNDPNAPPTRIGGLFGLGQAAQGLNNASQSLAGMTSLPAVP